MRELNPIGRDQDSLLLVTSDGERFVLNVDDALMRTLKEKKLQDAPGVELTPRQIQDAIRSGSSITELAESSGSSLDFIERFAHPVLEELGHMIDLALAVRIELPADRFNEVTKKAFGEIVEENLRTTGASQISWSAKRGENSVWEITVNFELNSSKTSATWVFDPRSYLLSPESKTAQNLSTPGVKLDMPVSHQAPVESTPAKSESETVVTADKLQAFRKRREQVQALEEPALEEEVEATVEAELEPTLTVLDVEESEVSSVQVTEIITEPITPEEQPAPKKSRAPMPSWDEIVRGTQSDDGESF